MGRHNGGSEKIDKEVAMPVFTAKRQWLAVLLAVFMAVALSACGGGSSKTAATMPDPKPMPDPMPDPAIAEREAINTAIMAARTAVSGVNNDSTDTEVSSADTAITNARTAIAAATNVPAEETAANTVTVDTLESQLSMAKKARKTAMDDAYDKMKAEMKATGKALHAALAGNATADTTALDNATFSLSSSGLMVTPAAGAGANADAVSPPAQTLKAGDPDGSLSGWRGMNYSHTASDKVVNAAVVYTNQADPTSKPFNDVYEVADATAGTVPAFTEIKGSLTVDGTNDAERGRVTGDAFTHSGQQNHATDSDTGIFTTRGYYDGAPGEYRCTGTCSSTNDGKGSPSILAGTWHFKPDAGAMVSQPDANYLYYGWWVNKDKDGGPTAASAFAGEVGDVDNVGDTATDTASGETLTGSATYVGNAAGKFAMTGTLDDTDNGGHFTADAALTAKFGAIAADNDNGVTGMINNFRLNDGSEDPGWSVSLNASTAWGADGAITGADTTWSINGVKAAKTGTWSATMHDEKAGNAPSGDGSNVPTTVTGTFYSEYSSRGRMVGAFGADRQ